MKAAMGTLIVGTWSSKCGNCGKPADPMQKAHTTMLGYGDTNGRPGCGVVWTHITTEYIGLHMEKSCKQMRPDLEYI